MPTRKQAGKGSPPREGSPPLPFPAGRTSALPREGAARLLLFCRQKRLPSQRKAQLSLTFSCRSEDLCILPPTDNIIDSQISGLHFEVLGTWESDSMAQNGSRNHAAIILRKSFVRTSFKNKFCKVVKKCKLSALKCQFQRQNTPTLRNVFSKEILSK